MEMNTRIGVVSGFFNPLHGGHIDYINGAREKCDYLIVIINNDDQVKIKGSVPFMDESHRQKIVGNLKSVDETIISIDKGKSIAYTLSLIRDRFPENEISFFNSGDRQQNNLVGEETEMCKKREIKEIVLSQSKVYSSSELVKKIK